MVDRVEIQRITLKSSAGFMVVEGNSKRIKRLHFLENKRISGLTQKPSGVLKEAINWIENYFAHKEKTPFPWKYLDPDGGTPFERKVWCQLWKIPFGKLESYGGLAKKVGFPQAARAVGQALKKNPLPLFIPCHRVIASDGSMGGYTPGVPIKRKLLQIEGSLRQLRESR